MDYPQRDDLVIVRVSQILDYGTFVELMEYNNLRGFVHISNVSTSWVKNIRNFVKMNQVRAAKVLNVDVAKGQIDLSFAGVTPQRERQKINEFRQMNREEKLVQLLAAQEKKKFDEVWSAVAEPLINEYGSLFEAFEKIALGEDVSSVISKSWVGPVKELVEKNVAVSKKTLKGVAKVQSFSTDGIEDIKTILGEASSIKGCEVAYLGAGNYSVSCTSLSFKEADKLLMKFVDAAEKKAKKLGVTFEFKKEENK